MTSVDPISLLNERERLKNEKRTLQSSNKILAPSESKRIEDILKERNDRLINDGKAIVGKEFSSYGKIINKQGTTILVEQKKSITCYDYEGKEYKSSCIISVQFPNASNFHTFILDDKVFFRGTIKKVRTELTSNTTPYYLPTANTQSPDIIIENISFQKQEKKDDYCFIATAVYGEISHPVVQEFRQFRDRKLMKNKSGTLFVKFYYQNSPYFAKVISKSSFLRTLVKKCLLNPIYFLIKHTQ